MERVSRRETQQKRWSDRSKCSVPELAFLISQTQHQTVNPINTYLRSTARDLIRDSTTLTR